MCPTAKYHCSAQPPSIPAVTTNEYPCNAIGCAQLQSITAVPNHQVSLQWPIAKYPCNAKPQNILAVPNCKVSLQCPTAEYPCSVQPPNIPAVPKRRVSLECPTAKYQYSCFAFAVLQGRQWGGGGGWGRGTLHFVCNNGFRVGMLEVNYDYE